MKLKYALIVVLIELSRIEIRIGLVVVNILDVLIELSRIEIGKRLGFIGEMEVLIELSRIEIRHNKAKARVLRAGTN